MEILGKNWKAKAGFYLNLTFISTKLEKEIIIKPCTHKQLAASYGVSAKVLRTWLKPHQQFIGQRKGYKYSLEQLFVIFDKMGLPQHSIV
jgi:hypothetical protein